MGILSTPNSKSEAGRAREEESRRLAWEQLAPGTALAESAYVLDAPLVHKYNRAVKGEGSIPGYVPPTAIAAYAMGALAKVMILPPGTIHAAQELEFSRPVPVGVSISCRGKVAQKVERGKLRMLLVDLEAVDGAGERLLSGRATLVLPG